MTNGTTLGRKFPWRVMRWLSCKVGRLFAARRADRLEVRLSVSDAPEKSLRTIIRYRPRLYSLIITALGLKTYEHPDSMIDFVLCGAIYILL